MASEFRQPESADGEVSKVVAGANRRRAKSPIVLVWREQRQILSGQIVRRVDTIRSSPRDDLTTESKIEPAKPQIHERLTHLTGRVGGVQGPAERSPSL